MEVTMALASAAKRKPRHRAIRVMFAAGYKGNQSINLQPTRSARGSSGREPGGCERHQPQQPKGPACPGSLSQHQPGLGSGLPRWALGAARHGFVSTEGLCPASQQHQGTPGRASTHRAGRANTRRQGS